MSWKGNNGGYCCITGYDSAFYNSYRQKTRVALSKLPEE